jgi:hypothetical protein
MVILFICFRDVASLLDDYITFSDLFASLVFENLWFKKAAPCG